jgi:hypothetical protein
MCIPKKPASVEPGNGGGTTVTSALAIAVEAASDTAVTVTSTPLGG